MVKAMRIDGTDISHHQEGQLDYQKAKKAGVKFVYHKATEGTSFRDENYAQRRSEARRAGMPFGAYGFVHPDHNDAIREARFLLDVSDPQPGDLVPAIDLEINPERMSRAELTNWVGDFVREVRRRLGVLPVIYTPFDLDRNFGCLLWQPRYNNDNRPPETAEPWRRVDIWQFSNGHLGVPNAIPGFGKVDINTFFHDDIRVADFRIPMPEDELERTNMFRVISQNVRALPLMKQENVIEDVLLTTREAGIVGWQEIGPDRYKDAVEQLDPDVWRTYWAGHNEERWFDAPISWRRKVWRKIDGGSFQLHPPRPDVSVRRIFNWVLLQHRKTKAVVLVTNKHYIARAFGKQRDDNQADRKKWWREARDLELNFLRDFIKKHPGAAIINLGDYNAMLAPGGRDQEEYPRSIARRKIDWQVGNRAIDQIFLINGTKWKFEVDDEDGELMPGRNSDHQGRRSTQRLVEKR